MFRMYAASLSPDLVPPTAARFARTYSSPGGLRIDRILGDTYERVHKTSDSTRGDAKDLVHRHDHSKGCYSRARGHKTPKALENHNQQGKAAAVGWDADVRVVGDEGGVEVVLLPGPRLVTRHVLVCRTSSSSSVKYPQPSTFCTRGVHGWEVTGGSQKRVVRVWPSAVQGRVP